jgi:hypothetical protein
MDPNRELPTLAASRFSDDFDKLDFKQLVAEDSEKNIGQAGNRYQYIALLTESSIDLSEQSARFS